MLFSQEACEACTTFVKETGCLFDDWCGKSLSERGSGNIESVQENNPPMPTLASIMADPSKD